ncbi:MAG: NUDIX domain-containing protein [Ruminococcus sp.]|nr:NUDIX domain-containing protein [Ruminococcus sp.]
MSNKLRNMTAIYLLHKSKILLLYRQGGKVVNNVWVASAGGHFEKNELNDPKRCVIRELEEELGLAEKDLTNFKMRYVALRRINDEIRQNYYFFAEVLDEEKCKLTSNEGTLKWFDISEINALEMPYTAKYVIEHYLNIGVNKSQLYCGVADGKQVTFIELPEY